MGFFDIFTRKEQRNLTQEEQDTNNGSGVGLQFLKSKYTIPSINLSGVFAAVELISNSVAEIPIKVKTHQDNKTDTIDYHPIYDMFRNSQTTKFTLIKMLVKDMLLEGNGIAYIDRNPDGTPMRLVYCRRADVTIRYNEKTRDLYYLIPSVKKGKIEPIDVIHLIKNSDNGIEGIGILKYAANTLELAKYTETAANGYFSNGMHVAGILSTESRINSDKQRNEMRTAWNEAHGPGGSGLAILELGMKYQPVANNSKESQLLETRLFNLNEIARFFNISPVLLGDLSHSSYSTIEGSLLEFVTHTLFPYISLLEDELTRKLIKPSERNLYVDLDENHLIRSDKQSQANYLKTLVSGGIITVNEARETLGFNPMDGADNLFVAFTDINQNQINKSESKEDEQ